MEAVRADGARWPPNPEGRAPARSHSRDGFKPSPKGVLRTAPSSLRSHLATSRFQLHRYGKALPTSFAKFTGERRERFAEPEGFTAISPGLSEE